MAVLPVQVEEAGKKADEALSTLAGLKDGNTEPAPEGKTGEPTPQGQTEPTVKDPEASPKEPDSLEHKFKVLQGKYNKEVVEVRNALQSENTRLKDQVASATMQISELKKMVDELIEQSKSKPPAPVEMSSTLSDDDRATLEKEDISPEVVNVINKLINAAVENGTKPLADRVGNTEKTVIEQRTMSFQDKVLSGIKQQTGKTYEEINGDAAFSAWLDQPLPYVGITRRNVGERASKDGDSATFIQLYVDFVNSSGNPSKVKKPNPLEKEIEPESSNATETPLTYQQDKAWTRAEVAKFYTDVTKGLYAGKEAEANKIDESIKLADSRGLITQ